MPLYMPLAFGFGSPGDWTILLVLALIVFGPKRLPEIGKQIGQALREFRKVADDLTGVTASVREDLSSVYNPMRATPAARPTFEPSKARSYDQEPVDLMAPVVPSATVESAPPGRSAHGLTLSTLPPEGSRNDVPLTLPASGAGGSRDAAGSAIGTKEGTVHMMMPLAFGLGGPQDIAIIAIVVVILFGGSKIGGLGKSLGESIREFKKATREEDETPVKPAVSSDKPDTVVTEEKKS